MSRKIPAVLLILALLSYLIRWIGIRFLGSEILTHATPLHLGLLTVLLAVALRKDRKVLLWMAGIFALSLLAVWAISGIRMEGSANPALVGLYQMVFLTGICSVVSLSPVPAWQKTAGAVLLAFLLGWLLVPVAATLGYWQAAAGTPVSGIQSLVWGGVAAVAAGSWGSLRLRPAHFAIALLLMEAVFLALLRL